MGNSPLTVCINQAWEKQTVQVVLPDGQVLFLPHPLTASMLMESHPYHFVCQGSPSLLEQRLPMDAKLETGELYYLIPVPPSDFPGPKASPAQSPLPGGKSYGGGGQLSPKIVGSSPVEKIQKGDDESLGLDKSGSFSRLKLGPQQCLINLLVFRQSVASVMPEETLKGGAVGIAKGGGDGAILSGRKVSATGFVPGDGRTECMEGSVFQPQLSALLANGNPMSRLDSRHHRASKGRNSKLGLTWRPELPSISENRPWVDLKPMNFINDFSVSLITTINTSMKTTLSSGPNSVSIKSTPPSSLPNSLSPVSSSPNTPAPTVRLFEELARPDRSPLHPSQNPSPSPRISSSASRISSSPARILSSPSRIPYSPSRVPTFPSRVPSSPSRVPSSPSRVPSSPSRASSLIVGSSPLSARTPARVPTSARKRTSQSHVSNASVHFPCSPARIPSSPARILDSPMHFPSSPARVPSSPLHFPSTRFPPSPLQFLGSPSVFHPSPLPRVCSPARGPGSPSVRNFQRQRFVYSA